MHIEKFMNSSGVRELPVDSIFLPIELNDYDSIEFPVLIGDSKETKRYMLTTLSENISYAYSFEKIYSAGSVNVYGRMEYGLVIEDKNG